MAAPSNTVRATLLLPKGEREHGNELGLEDILEEPRGWSSCAVNRSRGFAGFPDEKDEGCHQ